MFTTLFYASPPLVGEKRSVTTLIIAAEETRVQVACVAGGISRASAFARVQEAGNSFQQFQDSDLDESLEPLFIS